MIEAEDVKRGEDQGGEERGIHAPKARLEGRKQKPAENGLLYEGDDKRGKQGYSALGENVAPSPFLVMPEAREILEDRHESDRKNCDNDPAAELVFYVLALVINFVRDLYSQFLPEG